MPNKFSKYLKFSLILGFLNITVHATDITAPATTATYSPSSPNGNNGWYVTPVDITLDATDLESGVKSINYRVDAGNWQSISFTNSLNLAPNPSLEEIDSSNTPIIKDWSASVLDADTAYSRDTSDYAPGFSATSGKIVTTGTGWHGINNQLSFAAANPLSNMSASVWLKTQDVAETAYFNAYLVTADGLGNKTYTFIGSSPTISGTTDWTNLELDFVANSAQTVGVYLDIGLTGTGTVWADAITITYANTGTQTSFTVGTDDTHTIEYYSVDNNDNIEAHSCVSPLQNCGSFKIDQNAPGSWYDAGAVRGQGSDHEVFVYSNVQDEVSGMSTLSNQYMYHVEDQSGFGRFQDLLHCNTPWQENTWVPLASDAFSDGDDDVQLKTQKTDMCNNNWKICKTVRFYAEDMAGNNTTKDFCINGPWISFTGGGIVRSNGGIDMIAEPVGDNTDGLIEVGNNLISFFSSSRNWKLKNSPQPPEADYDKWLTTVKPVPTTITSIGTTTGVFLINSDFELKNTTIPNSYDSASFNQIIFVNGNLKISNNISVHENSTALYIVKGNVEIDKSVDVVGIAIFADGDLYSAYNISEGQTTSTLDFKGVFIAENFYFQRTLQGTNNSTNPSENFTYEPKYAINLADYLGTNSIRWIRTD